MSVYPYYYTHPRTTNEGYGAFSVKDPSHMYDDAIKRQLRKIYSGWEARLGVTTNSEYGSYSRKFPSRCFQENHYGVDPDYRSRGLPKSKDSRWCSPVLTSKLTQQPEQPDQQCYNLPPISYRPRVPTPPPDAGPSEGRNQSFCRPQPPPPLTDRSSRRMPLPPLPTGKSQPRYNASTARWEYPSYHQQLMAQSPRSPLASREAVHDSPRLFPPLYRTPPLPPVGHEECSRPREAVFHYGSELIPFSDVETVELHMKNRGKLMLNVEELSRRYIS